MKLRTLSLLALLYLSDLLVLWAIVYFCMKDTTLLHSAHYAVDTMTLRGRLNEPADEQLRFPRVFKIAEDIASIYVFSLFGFGIGFYIHAIETLSLRREYRSTGQHAHRSFKDWVREQHPEYFQERFADEHETDTLRKRLRRWLDGPEGH